MNPNTGTVKVKQPRNSRYEVWTTMLIFYLVFVLERYAAVVKGDAALKRFDICTEACQHTL